MTVPRDEGFDQTHAADALRTEVLGQLAAALAHDFNNTFSSILLNLEALQKSGELPSQVGEVLHELGKEAAKGAQVTRRLAAFGQLADADPRPLELSSWIRQSVASASSLLGSKVQVRFEPPRDPLWVNADPMLLEVAFENVLLNAAEAMPRGGITSICLKELNASTPSDRRKAPNAGMACLSVADEGKGMDSETLRRIFDPFYTTKPKGRLAGLGLTVVRRIVESHGGRVAASSKVNQGSRFEIHLPTTAPPRFAVDEMPIVNLRGQETILFVEDQHALRRSAALSLRKLGYGVLEASTARQALEVLEEHGASIDLVVTDQILPDAMRGHQLAREIRKRRIGLAVVLCTGCKEELSQVQTMARDEFAYLSKPYCADTLALTVRRCLDQSPAGSRPRDIRDEAQDVDS